MYCEQAIHLISAQIDREISAEEKHALEQHLEQCPACRVTLEAFQHQDHELRQTFEPRLQAVRSLVSEVNSSLVAPGPKADSWSNRYTPQLLLLGSLAAAVAVILALAWRTRTGESGVPVARTNQRAEKAASGWLTPRPRPQSPDPRPLQVGEEVQTKAGERRRVLLPDRSVLFVNQQTAVRVESDRTVSLSAGSVYLEVAPQKEKRGSTFLVKTPTREVKALGTHFSVAADSVGTEILVTQGKVQVSGLNQPLLAGQQLERKSQKPVPAPRSSHLLEWTRDLVAEAESPLVPGSQYSGGALIAVDHSGQQAKLSLRKYHVDVHVEDGFARTTIDQTYFNHHPWRLEGTFYFPLPPDASLSRLAMYVDGNLMEGGMTERDYARAVYEKIVRSQKDPALLEWVDGSTFKMRVFPLEGRQEKRIILSYSQRLSTLYGKTSYRFPAGHNLQLVNEWSFQARVKNADGWLASSPTHPEMGLRRQNGDLVLSDRRQGVKVDQDVALELSNPSEPTASVAGASERIRLGKAQHEKNTYLMLRYRPDLPGRLEPVRRDFLFLFESSADRDPLLARTQIEIIRALLSQANHGDTFNIVTAGTLARFWSREQKPVTVENVQAALAWLEGTHLIGALDLGEALRVGIDSLRQTENPHLVHLGSGLTGMGEVQDQLLQMIPDKVHYVGIGVGKRWGRGWMKQAAEKTGGHFTQINPDESISWRAFDLLATLNTPRLLDVRVEARVSKGPAPLVLVDNPTIAQGEELFAVTRIDDLPEALIVTGLLEGKPFRREVEVRDVPDGAGYLPRTWAKLEIDRLLASDSSVPAGEVLSQHEMMRRKEAIVELSKTMYVMTPYTSLLVLENEEMYKEHKVDRGRKDHWALYACPQKITVVYEPDPTLGIDARNAPRDGLPSCEQVMQTVLVRTPPQLLHRQNQSSRNDGPTTALQLYKGAVAWSGREEKELQEVELQLVEMERLGERTETLDRLMDGETRFNPWSETDRKMRLRTGKDYFKLERASRRLEGLSLDGTTSLLRAERKEVQGQQLEQLIKLRGGDIYSRSDVDSDVLNIRDYEGYTGRFARVQFELEDRKEARVGQINIVGNDRTRQNTILRPVPLPPRVNINGLLFDPEPAAAMDLSWGFQAGGAQGLEAARSDLLRRKRRQASSSLGDTNWTESALYQRLLFTGDDRLFTDLVSYAPGLNSTLADVRATVEAEAAPELRSSPGTIDPAARKLIERARQAGWQTRTLGDEKDSSSIRICYDGRGRYRYERTLPLGLREVVICDGKTLWHLYPEIGLASRRSVSRFHRAQIADLLGELLLPAEDLARGADVVLVDARTVAIVPHPVKDGEGQQEKKSISYRQHLVFADQGWLAERQVVEMPAGKVIVREVHGAGGLVRLLDAEGKERSKQQNRLSPSQEPELRPGLANLVVVPLPLRTREKAFETVSLDPGRSLADDVNGCYRYLDAHQAVGLLASLAVQRSEDAKLLLRNCYALGEELKPGHFVLFASGGFNLLDEQLFRNWVARQPDDPLIRFLALVSSRDYRFGQVRWPINLASGVAPEDTFLGRLARFFDLTVRESQDSPLLRWGLVGLVNRPLREQDAKHSLEFIRKHARTPWSLAMLCQMTQRSGHGSRWQLELAKVWGEMSKGGTVYEPTYEQARALYRAGHKDEARKHYLALYERTLEQGNLPVFDGDFMNALVEPGRADDPWMTLLQKTAHRLIELKSRPAVVLLAYQARALGDLGAFDNLLSVTLTGITDDRDRLETYLAANLVLVHHNQDARAEKLVLELLEHKEYRAIASLWRLAAHLADRQGQQSIGLDRLERALELEYLNLPDVINLETWRNDYRRLLDHYLALAPQVASSTDKSWSLVQRTIRTADRWRAHDPEEGKVACELAGQVLKRLGQEELAWEYLTSPIALHPENATRPADLAVQLNRTGDYALADRAYTTAFLQRPHDGQLLWDRSRNLIQAGQLEQGRQLLRQLVDSKEDWPQLKQRARWALGQQE